MSEELEITIAKDGTITAKVNGIKGSKCIDATKFLSDIGRIESSTKTSEYYETYQENIVAQSGT